MSTASSNQRHFIALTIIVFIYILPLMLPAATTFYWHRHILISCLCIALIYRYTTLQQKILYALFTLELTAIYSSILASKSQWFNDQFVSIMTIIFYTEIIIVIGSAGGGAIIRNYKPSRYLRKLRNYVYNRAKGNALGF